MTSVLIGAHPPGIHVIRDLIFLNFGKNDVDHTNADDVRKRSVGTSQLQSYY